MKPSARNHRLFVAGLIIASLVGLQSGTAASLTADEITQRIDAAFAEIERSDVPVIVAYSLDGGPVVAREFGRFRDDGVSASATQVDLLSITKSVTAVAILKLVERSALAVDNQLSELLPNVPEDKAGITVHQLLTHSAGILDSCGDDHEPIDKQGLLRCAFESDLVTEPGTEYAYSNVGYSILAAIIEQRSGKTFEAFLIENVFVDTGLHQTGYTSIIDDERSMMSIDGKPVSEASWGGPEPHWNLLGNGGLISTADEFLRFRQALAEGRIISPALLTEAHTAHVPEDPEGVSYYGYGVVVQERSSVGRLLWHNGGSGDFSSEWTELLDYRLTLFVAGLQLEDANAYWVTDLLKRHLLDLDAD